MSGRYCGTCGEMDYSDWGDMPCRCAYGEPQPAPTAEDYCASEGHVYHGDEANPEGEPPEVRATLGRCYCGAKRYPARGEA